MKTMVFSLLLVTVALRSQPLYYQLEACDEVILQGVGNSVGCLQNFYNDLKAYQQSNSFRFRYYESYNCVKQPNPQVLARAASGTDAFYKNTTNQLWKRYEQAYAKGGEIVAYVRLEDYKTNLEKGFALIREMQSIHASITELRDLLAAKVSTQAKAMAPANVWVKPYQAYLVAIRHEEGLLRKLAQNFNEAVYGGFSQEEILKSFLETEDILLSLKPANFKVPDPAPLKSCYEGFLQMQQHKRSALDDFNNTSTFDAQHSNQLYQFLIKQFNSDVLSFFAFFCGRARDNGFLAPYYPVLPMRFDMDVTAKPWLIKKLTYSPPQLDSAFMVKQLAALPTAGFNELNNIVYYINECVRSMENLHDALRSEQYTWERVRTGKYPVKNPVIKFDKFTIPVSTYALITKYKQTLPIDYRAPLLQRVDDLHQLMLVLQDHVFSLSQYMSSGAFRNQSTEFLETELKTIDRLYTELDVRKEKLFLLVRHVYALHPPAKTNNWLTAAQALLKAADDSRKILNQTELRAYHENIEPISTTSIHEARRDLITNELKYMAGIERIGKYNGLCPYNPYEYIPDYLHTLEEKILAMPMTIPDKNKTYQDIRYMHNIIVEQYNKFAEIALGDHEYGRRDPARPVYLLSYIRQPMLYRYQPPKPVEKKAEVSATPEPVVEVLIADVPTAPITFDGYPINNLVLLLDVSASMNKPGRLPLLKKDLTTLIKLMRPEDDISIVAYADKAAVVLQPTSARDTTKIIKAFKNLRSSGITNIADGLNQAYKLARKNFKPDGNNRIILATDGEFNMAESFYALAEKNADVPLTVFDFNEKSAATPALKGLAEKGAGNYVKIVQVNSLEALANEARKQK
jgi:Ca-activated chloride channel homolog